jgi:UPF0042 nucleotide-binding protein
MARDNNSVKKKIQVVVITGMSGSGKSTALKAFEDMGYYCVDNLPITLLPEFLSLSEKSAEIPTRIALVMDVREKGFLDQYGSIFRQVKDQGYHLEVLFLGASDNVLVQRFSQTRRKHPLQKKGDIKSAIQEERRRLRGLREYADNFIDTSRKNVHQLRRMVLDLYSSREDLGKPLIHVVSFGFKYGVPADAGLVFDVRFLPNPYFVPELRPLSGLEDPVYDFVFEKEKTREFVRRLEDLFSFLIPLYQEEGKVYLVIGIGCTGGRHRSVSVARWLGELFTRQGQEVIVTHRDLDREG